MNYGMKIINKCARKSINSFTDYRKILVTRNIYNGVKEKWQNDETTVALPYQINKLPSEYNWDNKARIHMFRIVVTLLQWVTLSPIWKYSDNNQYQSICFANINNKSYVSRHQPHLFVVLTISLPPFPTLRKII